MRNRKRMAALVTAFCALAITLPSASSQEKTAPAGVQVHVVNTDAALREDADLPPLQKEYVNDSPLSAKTQLSS
jgi:hypothetical protein